MALHIPLGYAHVVHSLRWTGDPEPMAVTYGVKTTVDAGPGSAEELAGSLGNIFASRILANSANVISLIQTEVRWQNEAPPVDPLVGVSTLGAGPGLVAYAGLLPQNSAFLVHKRSSYGGTRGRGRFYLPGVPENGVDNLGNLSSGTLADWNTQVGLMRTDIVALSTVDYMCILHSDGESAVPDPYPVASLTVDPVIATQRRRLRR